LWYWNLGKTEVAFALLLKGLFEGDVEVVSRIITESEKHLHNGSIMAHLQGNWE
jgi:hypothetical protein